MEQELFKSFYVSIHMKSKINNVIVVTLCILLLTACWNKQEQVDHVQQVQDFQNNAIPLLEEAYNKHFPNRSITKLTEEKGPDYYWDLDNLKVVLLVLDENVEAYKQLRIELEEKLGDKVIFRIFDFDLETIFNKLVPFTKEIEKQYAVTFLMMGRAAVDIHLKIRSYGDIERKIPSEEVESIKKDFYSHIGQEFPLIIEVQDCCKNPRSGKIEQIDSEKQRVLIPRLWLSLTQDGVILSGDKKLTFDQLEVGQEILAYGVDSVMLSSPAIGAALKIEVK